MKTDHPGKTQFDVNDRLAIVNLINTYAESFDRNDIEKWLSLFTDEPKVTFVMGNSEPLVLSGKTFKDWFLVNAGNSEEETGVIHRHLVSNVSVKQQSSNKAEVVAYITYIPLDVAELHTPRAKGKIDITGTARYAYQVEKGADSIWRIREYNAKYDQTNPTHTAIKQVT